jgi:N-acetylneuraminic acid mutarotase
LRRALVVAAVLAAAVPLAAWAAGWRWVKQPHAGLARTEVAGAVLRNGDVYVVGGFDANGRTTAVVERLRGRRWTSVRPLPVALNHPAAAGHRGYVYVLGGYASPNDLALPVATLYRYDPARDRWQKLPPMPAARAALALGATGGKLYAAGGADGSKAFRSLYVYDVARRRWSRGPSMSVAREHLGGAVYGGKFYVVGGRAPGAGNFAIAERYDPAKRRWTRLPDMPKARGGNGAAPIEGGIVAVGGEETAGTIAEVDAFDTRTGRWRRLPDMPTPRHGLAVVATGGRVCAIEGGPKPGLFESKAVECLNPSLE